MRRDRIARLGSLVALAAAARFACGCGDGAGPACPAECPATCDPISRLCPRSFDFSGLVSPDLRASDGGGDAGAPIPPDLAPIELGPPPAADLAWTPKADASSPGACAAPQPLGFPNGVASAAGDTRGSSPTWSGSCGGNGRELVYKFTTNSPQLLTVTASGDPQKTPAFQPVIYLRDSCAEPSADHELGCATSPIGQLTGIAQLDLRLPAGTWFLFVDGKDGSKGIFQLDATLADPPPPPAPDSCAAAAAFGFDMSGHAAFSGDLSGARDDARGACGGAGADVVYTFTTKAPGIFAAMATADPSTPAYTPVLHLRKTCADGLTELQCSEPTVGAAAALSQLALPAGTYFLWVDSADAARGKFLVEAWLGQAPMNDGCMGAAALPLMNGVAQIGIDTTAAKDDTASFGCGGQAPDVAYTVTTAGPASLVAQLSSFTRGFQPVVYLRTLCGDAGKVSEQACAGGLSFQASQIVVPRLIAGSFGLWVDGFRGTLGHGSLKVTLGPPMSPPPDDACAGATALSFMNGVATAAVDTTAANNDKGGSCGGADGPDEVYTFVLAAPQKVTATLSADGMSPGLNPVLHLRRDDGKGCAATVTESGCALPFLGTATLVAQRLPAGTYFLWADGMGLTRGKGTLTVQQEPPAAVPANNGCAAPVTLSAGMTVSGDTTPSNDLFGAKIAPVCDPAAVGRFAGRDLTFVYTPKQDGVATLLLTPAPSFDAALLVVPTACFADGSTCAVAADAPGNGSEEQLSFPVTANTAYYVVVDAANAAAAGTFTLSVR